MWTRPDANVIDPARAALLVVDVLGCYRPQIETSGALPRTALDLTPRVQGIDSVLVCGGSTHVGVASTVYAGREEQRAYFCEKIFPRMVRVRTTTETGAMIQTPERTIA